MKLFEILPVAHVTSDSDLWPLSERNHSLHFPGQEITVSRILSNRRNNAHSVALSCVGMKAKTWRELVNFQDITVKNYPEGPWKTDALWFKYMWKTPKTVARNQNEILDYLAKRFGETTVFTKVVRGAAKTRKTWFLDQDLCSALLRAWTERKGGNRGYDKVFWGKKATSHGWDGFPNRVNRGSGWASGIRNLTLCQDAHLPGSVFKSDQWSTIKSFIKKIWENDYPEMSEEEAKHNFCQFDAYQRKFEAVLLDNTCGSNNTLNYAIPRGIPGCIRYNKYRESGIDLDAENGTLRDSLWKFYDGKIEGRN